MGGKTPFPVSFKNANNIIIKGDISVFMERDSSQTMGYLSERNTLRFACVFLVSYRLKPVFSNGFKYPSRIHIKEKRG